MVKLKGQSLALSTMNTSRPHFSRGNKLFLPKIEYAKLTEPRSFNGEKPSIKNTISEGEMSNGEFKDTEKVPLLNDDYNMGSFTRFSVLPPIKDGVRKGRRTSHTRRFLSANGPSPASSYELTNKQGDEYRSHTYAGFSRALAQQRRNSNANHELVQNLQVVGEPYARSKHKNRLSGQDQSNARSPKRSFSSPTSLETSNSNCKGCQTLLMRGRSKTEDAKLNKKQENLKVDKVVHTCNKKETFAGQVLRRFNSENIDLLKEKHAHEQNNNTQSPQSREQELTLISKPERTNLLTANFAGGRRPVSRCEISVDVNDGEQQIQVATDREMQKVPAQQQNTAPPLIQIDRIETDSSGLTPKEEETLNSQGTPRIQILIDSLDSAKEELPKPGREVPYTSVREQRRRSALCRNNSKQVDDFLLVHNLRDLGLL